MAAILETQSDYGLGGWGCAFPDPSLAHFCRIWLAVFLVTFHPILCCKECMNTTTNQTLDIQGTQFNYAAASFKVALSAACIGLGIFLWPLREHTFWGDLDSADANLNRWFFAVVPLIIAAILPYKAHTILDFGNGRIVTLKYYAWFRTSNHRRSLTDFDRIVVRHVCHPGGEGPDTFTGSVGLHPTNGETVFWFKEFPTTQDEMPREAYKFAIALQKSLSLPMNVLGLEFLDLEKTRFVQPKTSPETDPASHTVGMPRRSDAG
jgi:hypothetical protein